MSQSLGDDIGGVVVRVTTSSASVVGREFFDRVLPSILDKLKNVQTVKSVKHFARSNVAIDKIPLESADVKDFIKECRKLGVQVAITKYANVPDLNNIGDSVKTSTDKVNITFRAGQTSFIEQAISNCCDKRFAAKGKVSIKERIAAAVRKLVAKKPGEKMVVSERQRGAR